MDASPAVSVIIPTYCSGAGLDEAIASLDAQRLAQDAFEVLLLDDGSPDDTPERIEQIAAGRSNYRSFRLEASGWPSRPRNIGVREARGRWVLFMDHDDTLFRRALKAAIKLGDASGADVVNGKEVRTEFPDWGLKSYTGRTRDASDRPLGGILPMTPHKLYRRDFLSTHEIAFPEAPRHLWEDVFFNIDVLRARPTIAILGDVPFYHWRANTDNNSAATDGTQLDYGGDPDYWSYLDLLFTHIRTIEDPDLRDELLAHTVDIRVATRIRRPGNPLYEVNKAGISHVLTEHVPPRIDALLSPRKRAAITLFRHGHTDEAAVFLRGTQVHRPSVRAQAVHLSDEDHDAVEVSGSMTWLGPGREPVARHAPNGGVVHNLPEDVLSLLTEAGVATAPDPSDTEVVVVLRHDRTEATWAVPATTETRLVEGPDGTLVPVGDFHVLIDRTTAAAGRPLPAGRYRAFAVVTLGDQSPTVGLHSDIASRIDLGQVIVDRAPRGLLTFIVPNSV